MEEYSKYQGDSKHCFCIFRQDGGIKEFGLPNPDIVSNFYAEYSSLTETENIGEKKTETIPLIVPFKFTFANPKKSKCPAKGGYMAITATVIETIKKLVDIRDDADLIFSLRTSSRFNDDKGNKCWMYVMQFHDIRLESEFIEGRFSTALISKLNRANICGLMSADPLYRWEEMLDYKYIEDYVPMFGSARHSYPKLDLRGFYYYDEDELTEQEPADIFDEERSRLINDDIINIESYRYSSEEINEYSSDDDDKGSDSDSSVVSSSSYKNKKKRVERKLDYEKLYPIFFSVTYGIKNSKINADKERKNPVLGTTVRRQFGHPKEGDVVPESPLESAIYLISLINVERFLCHADWLAIGAALHNITNGGGDGLQIWTDTTEKRLSGPKPNVPFLLPSIKKATESYYDGYVDSNITIKTLEWFARKDNPHGYYDWYAGIFSELVEKALQLDNPKKIFDLDVARCLHTFIHLKYLYEPLTKTIYMYDERKYVWVETHDITSIELIIVGEFLDEIMKINAMVAKRMYNTKNEAARERDANIIKKFLILIEKLSTETKSKTYARSVLKFIMHSSFEDIKNSVANILVAGKYTIEMISGKKNIRESRPEDYYTRRTRYDYDPSIDEKTPGVVRYRKILGQYFADPEENMTFRKFLSSGMVKGNPDKIIFAIVGKHGDEGKSSLANILKCIYGKEDVFHAASTAISGYKKSPDAPTPHVNRSIQTRFMIMDEADSNRETVKTGMAKLISGNDEMANRKMHKDKVTDVRITYKGCAIMNQMLPVENPDGPTINRFFFLLCTARYVSGKFGQPRLPDTKEEQRRKRIFPMIEDFDTKVIPSLGKYMLWQAVEDYEVYHRERFRNIPKAFLEFRNQFWTRNDQCTLYIADNVRNVWIKKDGKQIQNATARVSKKSLYKSFNKWFEQNYPRKMIPTSDIFIDKISSNQRFGPPNGKYWYGIKILDEDEQGEEDEDDDGEFPSPMPITAAEHKEAVRRQRERKKKTPVDIFADDE